ncbi:hypothetical protein [Streptomyces sp. NBC_00233]|uniref:hypothetical protein n=1 Tax=Streptomyces sp. NBC_00233 TaxID=2975686 RepID=UPI002254DE0A|nr:hypothetical protein [Streptomyces sp. NBC_00233]MCX5233072.1 hypothetical protein [Streptomyces sp. NBC_00233]
MTSTEPSVTDAQQRRKELEELHRLQVAALDAYDNAVEHAALAQAGLSRSVVEAVEVFGGLAMATGLLGITAKEARAHMAAHEAATSEQPDAAVESAPGAAEG